MSMRRHICDRFVQGSRNICAHIQISLSVGCVFRRVQVHPVDGRLNPKGLYNHIMTSQTSIYERGGDVMTLVQKIWSGCMCPCGKKVGGTNQRATRRGLGVCWTRDGLDGETDKNRKSIVTENE